MIRQYVSTLIGKTVRTLARLRGSGSALPGLVVEQLDSNFLARTLRQLPHGVVLISGTNGKTTTTKMVVELLKGQGLTVFTNRTGSNFTRGVVAALLGDVSLSGKLDADIAVLELDEAHAVHFVREVAPRHALLLNVMRDQLDRFGEIDKTAKLLESIALRTTEGVVINREDPRLLRIGQSLTDVGVAYFGLDSELLELFPDDDSLHGSTASTGQRIDADVLLQTLKGQTASFLIDDKTYTTPLRLKGVYNIYNATAALALVRQICGKDTDMSQLITTLGAVEPAFGRGETVTVDGQPLELVLVKNPSGFRLGLSSFSAKDCATMIAINDNYADGRDMSWLWDVSFESLADQGVEVVSGVRAYDMALRLQYDEVLFRTVEPNLKRALKQFVAANPTQPKRIYCTYTAMLALRQELGKLTSLGAIDP